MDVVESWAGMIWIGSVSLTYVHDVLHKGEAWWGYVNGVYYAGTMIGGLIIYKLSGKFQHHLIPLMLTGALAYGMFTFIYGLITSAVTTFLVLCMVGLCITRSHAGNITSKHHDRKDTGQYISGEISFSSVHFMFSIIGTGLSRIYSECGLFILAHFSYYFRLLSDFLSCE